jgi:hypothetical protein
MPKDKWELITEVPGELQADLLRNLLEAQGIQVFLNQEGAGRAYGLTVGPMGEVQVLVPSHQSQEARKIVEDYFAGKFESDSEEPPDPDESAQG